MDRYMLTIDFSNAGGSLNRDFIIGKFTGYLEWIVGINKADKINIDTTDGIIFSFEADEKEALLFLSYVKHWYSTIIESFECCPNDSEVL